MILGIGTDIISTARIARLLDRQGASFLERCFAPEEQAAAQDKTSDTARAAFYAKRWAAKEACAKALGTGIRDGISLKDIVVMNDKLGKPFLTLRNGAQAHLDTLTPQGAEAVLHLSLSDEPPTALAFVMIETRQKTTP